MFQTPSRTQICLAFEKSQRFNETQELLLVLVHSWLEACLNVTTKDFTECKVLDRSWRWNRFSGSFTVPFVKVCFSADVISLSSTPESYKLLKVHVAWNYIYLFSKHRRKIPLSGLDWCCDGCGEAFTLHLSHFLCCLFLTSNKNML